MSGKKGAAALYNSPNIFFKPFWPEMTSKNTLAWKAHQPMSRTVAKFIEFVKERVGSPEDQA